MIRFLDIDIIWYVMILWLFIHIVLHHKTRAADTQRSPNIDGNYPTSDTLPFMGVISVECPNLRLTIKYITDTFLVSYLAPLPSCHLAPQTIPVILPTPQAHPPSPMVHSANQSLTVNLLVSPSPSEEREKMRAKCRWILTRYSECGVKIRIIPPNMDIYLF